MKNFKVGDTAYCVSDGKLVSGKVVRIVDGDIEIHSGRSKEPPQIYLQDVCFPSPQQAVAYQAGIYTGRIRLVQLLVQEMQMELAVEKEKLKGLKEKFSEFI